MNICKLRQFRISSALDDGRELPASLEAHTDHCPNCRQFLQRSRTLSENLELVVPSGDTPPWLQTRVMAQVQSASPAHPSPQRNWLPALAGVSAIAIAAILVNLSVPRDTGPEFHTAAAQLSPPVTPIHPASMTNSLEKHAKATLSKEFQHLAADLNGARDFLAASLRNTLPGLSEE